jgi:hypothetical protein
VLIYDRIAGGRRTAGAGSGIVVSSIGAVVIGFLRPVFHRDRGGDGDLQRTRRRRCPIAPLASLGGMRVRRCKVLLNEAASVSSVIFLAQCWGCWLYGHYGGSKPARAAAGASAWRYKCG